MAIHIKGPLVAGVLAALGASACCVGPLVLLGLGIGGAWVANLAALAPYSPYFAGLTLLFLGRVFYQLHLRPRACRPDTVCADERVIKHQRLLFWCITVPVILLLAFPWFAPLFY